MASGADVNEQDTEGATPAHAAAYSGYADVLGALLDAGAQVSARDHYGFTPLHAAAREGQLAAARVLVQRGADLSALDESGLSAEQVARFMGQVDVADYLASLAPPVAAQTLPETHAEIETPQSIWLTGATFRVWSSRAGTQLEAEFVQNVLDTVMLRKRDGNLVRIALPQLSPEDQALVRQLTGVAPHIRSRVSVSGGGSGREHGESIGLKIGRTGGWTVLEGCRLLKRSGNDGDSFHVQHEGKEYIFRLYYVDTPEKDLSFPDRVRDQARYFGLDEDDTLRLGKEAAQFTDRILSRGVFTVVTKWEDARGNSRLPREYAFVITPDGDLDELLIAEGLVRLYGMRVDGGYGSQKLHVLKRLEAEAKRDRLGAWGVDRRASAEAQ